MHQHWVKTGKYNPRNRRMIDTRRRWLRLIVFRTKKITNANEVVLVLMESCAGTGHRFAHPRLKVADKAEMIRWDPWVRAKVLYKEKKKLKTL